MIHVQPARRFHDYFQFQTDPYTFTMAWSGAALVVLALVVFMERALFAWVCRGVTSPPESRVCATGESLTCAAE